MSGSSKGVRSFSLERIYSDLKKIVSSRPKLIKFVDRTFNYNLKRACQIFSCIIDNFSECGVSFHFEMAPELFNEEMFSILKCAKKGLFQFEIGVQSYNDKTLVAISRKANSSIVDSNISRIINMGNIPVHVDLIAGLFYENLQSFIDGFNRLISLSPNELQLGFLKILNGSKMAEEADGYVYSHQAPYEIYSTPWLSFDDVVELKRVESVLNVYYNSGKFTSSLSYLFTLIDDKYSFFKELYNYIFSNGYLVKELSFNKKCDALYYFSLNYFSEEVLESSYLEELIAKDFLNAGNVRTWHKRPLSHING
jgi:radical SAM superfamily enzyme YgiQ (UPF0313 family)